jgi:hypothetical protein
MSYDSWRTRTPDDECAAEGEEFDEEMGMNWSSFESGEHDILSWLESGVPGYLCSENVRARAMLWCLAHNLRVAAGLCRAHQIGNEYGSDESQRYVGWSPGCGRPAP